MKMGENKVLVTGGAGFIGSYLVKRLLDIGYSVRVFDNQFRGLRSRLEFASGRIEYVEADIRDEEKVFKAFEGIDVVYHLAFINGTRHFYEIPGVVLDVGVRGALNTIKAALNHNRVGRYVLASSSEVYQTPTRVPTDETERILLEDILNPRYSYAGGKIISELLAINMFRDTHVDFVIFRPHNVFGPDMGYEHVIPELMIKIMNESDCLSKKDIVISIQGSGKETRAFCYIENAIEQIVLCGEKGYSGEIYHVGEMREISISDLVLKMGEALGLNITIERGPIRQGGTPRRCPETTKIESLGVFPRIEFEEGLKRTVMWYADKLKLGATI